jgi:type II secretory pathway component PulF
MDASFFDNFQANFAHKMKTMQFGSKAQLAFLEDLSLLVADGIPPNRAIDMLGQVNTGIGKEVALYISYKIGEGQALAEGMRPWFGPNVIEIIRVGEEGGALAQTILSAIKTLSQSNSTWGGFVSAVAYPVLVMIMACAIMLYLNASVFTQFAEIKPMDKWPQAGRDLVGIANFIQSWWWLAIAGLIVIILILRRLMDNYIGELRQYLDKIPPFSLYRRFAAAHLMETLGLLVTNGVVFKNALKVMQYQANPYVLSHLLMMEHFLGSGKGNVADVLYTGLIDEKDILRLRIMAEVKGFEHGLTRMGVHGAEQTVKTLKTAGKFFGGALLAFDAYLIITIVRGIFLTGMAMGGGG